MHQMKGNQRVALAVGRIDLEHLLDPRVRGAIGQQLHRGVDGHGVEGIGRNLESRVGLLDRLRRIGVFQREAGQELVGFDQLRIEGERLGDVSPAPCCRSRQRSPARGRDRLRRSWGRAAAPR